MLDCKSHEFVLGGYQKDVLGADVWLKTDKHSYNEYFDLKVQAVVLNKYQMSAVGFFVLLQIFVYLKYWLYTQRYYLLQWLWQDKFHLMLIIIVHLKFREYLRVY